MMTELLTSDKRLLQSILDKVPAMIYIKDEAGRYQFMNAHMQTAFNVTLAEVLGKTDQELPRLAQLTEGDEKDNRLPGNGLRGREKTLELPGGARKHHLHTVPLTDTRGNVGGVCGIATDLFEHTETQKALVRAEKMAAIGTLAAGVAHEFNNLNTAALGFLDLVLKSEELPQSMRRNLRQVEIAIKRSSSVTHSLLSFARKKTETVEVCNLNKVIQDTLTMLEREFTSEGIEIDCYFSPIPMARLDSGVLAQVFLNLLINARHAMADQKCKRLTIKTGFIDEALFFTVRDTGCGIAKEVQKNLFKAFYTTKRSCEETDAEIGEVCGTGLGLSLSLQMIEAQGGTIIVQSQLGVGAEFTVQVPFQPVELRMPEVPEINQVKPLADTTILVLEDEDSIREILEIELSQAGATIFAMTSGAEALELISEKQIDIALVDLQMPKMSGVEFLRRLNAMTTASRPEVFVVTGNITESHRADYQVLGVRDVIEKPFFAKELIEQLCAALPELK